MGGFLGVPFACVCLWKGGGGVKLPHPCLKIFIIMLYAASEDMLMLALFLQKNSIFLAKIVPLLKTVV